VTGPQGPAGTVLGYGSFITTSTSTLSLNSAMRSWTSTVSGGTTPISTVGGSNNTQITLPVAGDYHVGFQMNRRQSTNQVALQVVTGSGCTGTVQLILSDDRSQNAPAGASGIIRTTAANTLLQICQKSSSSIQPKPWVTGAITGMLTVTRLN
jgi:hypothetical protein